LRSSCSERSSVSKSGDEKDGGEEEEEEEIKEESIFGLFSNDCLTGVGSETVTNKNQSDTRKEREREREREAQNNSSDIMKTTKDERVEIENHHAFDTNESMNERIGTQAERAEIKRKDIAVSYD